MVERMLYPALLAALTATVLAGCAGARTAGQETAVSGETAPPVGTTSAPAGLETEAVSSERAYVLAGFGEGSVWATDPATCDDTSTVGSPDSSVSAACAASSEADMPLRRLDPRGGGEEAAVPLENFFASTTEVAFGAGYVWACSTDYYPGPPDTGPDAAGGVLFKVDPETSEVVDKIPVPSSSGVAFGHGSVWVTSAGHETMSRIDPKTGRVVAEIGVGRGAVDVAVDEGSGAVWVAGLYLSEDYDASAASHDPKDNRLSRVDPETNKVVAEVPIRANSSGGGAQNVVVGGDAVWAASVGGDLFKVDPGKNEVVAVVPLGAYSSDLEFYDGSVWATVQISQRTRLVRVAPRPGRVVASEDLGPVSSGGYGRLAAGGGHVWSVSDAGEGGGSALVRVAT